MSTVRGRVARLPKAGRPERAWGTPPASRDPRRRERCNRFHGHGARMTVAPVAVDSYSMQGVGLLREVTAHPCMEMAAADPGTL